MPFYMALHILFLIPIILNAYSTPPAGSDSYCQHYQAISITPGLLPRQKSLVLSPRRLTIRSGQLCTALALLLIGGIEPNPRPVSGKPNTTPSATQGLRGALLNIRSAVNKAANIHDIIDSHNLDFVAITKTWLRTDDPPAILKDITPDGFS